MAVIWQTLFDLRRPIAFCPDISRQSVHLSNRCMVKVSNFKVELLINKNILALEVQVSNLIALKTLQCTEYLTQNETTRIFTQATFPLINTAQITAFDVLQS